MSAPVALLPLANATLLRSLLNTRTTAAAATVAAATATARLHSTSTSSSAPSKKQITLRTGDPRSKKWAQLSSGQKVVRTASTGMNAATILVGLALTGAIFTFVYLEVVAPDSVTNWFNRAHERIKADAECVQLLGGGRIKAYGEPTSNRWARNRPIAANVTTDRSGVEHLRIHFNVEGDLEKGVVNLHLIKKPGQSEYEYKYLSLDVAGRSRVYLENADDTQRGGSSGGKKRGFLGVKWGW